MKTQAIQSADRALADAGLPTYTDAISALVSITNRTLRPSDDWLALHEVSLIAHSVLSNFPADRYASLWCVFLTDVSEAAIEYFEGVLNEHAIAHRRTRHGSSLTLEVPADRIDLARQILRDAGDAAMRGGK